MVDENDSSKIPEDGASTFTSQNGFTDPQKIGNYKILRKIGEGGMGAVYEAEQERPVKRKVALKLIKLGMDTKQVVARFETERQALALMNHPGIAKVYDAGATEKGRPYFVMEHVQGIPITQYCDMHRLTTKERLKLFMHVCEAVQHAHQKGVIHRDIKASNVLVTVQDDKPVPKIIDFGVAKATAQKLTELTVYTEFNQLIGTPEYMSPEQAEMTGLDIDTRTDVYSLGVLLYELLVGVLPHESKTLRQVGFDEIRRKIREEEAPKPSTRLSTLGDASTVLARKRRTNVTYLSRQLRGDLDWITMKALEKDRTRRYGSPNELAADIKRHLRHEAVLASPPSKVYRMGKFIRRHRLGVSVFVLLSFIVLAFSVAITIEAIRLSTEVDRANRERDRANREATTAKEIAYFMTGLFEVSDPSEARGNTITAREILDKGAHRINNLSEQPEVQANMMNTIGVVYKNLGLYPEAEPLLEKALDTRKRVLGEEHPDTLQAMNDLAILYKCQGRYHEAERLYLKTIEGRRRVLGNDDIDTLATMNNLAVIYTTQGPYEKAEPLLLQVTEGFRRVLGNEHKNTLAAMHNLALFYQNQKRYDEAEVLYIELIEIQSRVLSPDHPNTLQSKNNLANIYREKGRYDEAEQLLLETLESRRKVLGEDHPNTLQSKNNLAIIYGRQHRYNEAERLLLETLKGFERIEGEDHPDTAWTLEEIIHFYSERNEPYKAKSYLARLMSIRRKASQRPGAGTSEKNQYASLLLTCEPADQRDPKTALKLAIEVNNLTGNKDPEYLDTLALAYHLTGQTEKAIETQRKAISLIPEGKSSLRTELEARLAEFKEVRVDKPR